jgi:hypothetical protein
MNSNNSTSYNDSLIAYLEKEGLDISNLKDKIKSFDSKKNKVETKIPFGKYKGQTIRDVIEIDKEYIIWLLASKLNEPNYFKGKAKNQYVGPIPNTEADAFEVYQQDFENGDL